jgi:hypothetical protein
MTKQEQNDIIIQNIDKEIRDLPDVAERVTNTFQKWFQALISMAAQATTAATQEEPMPEEGAPV